MYPAVDAYSIFQNFIWILSALMSWVHKMECVVKFQHPEFISLPDESQGDSGELLTAWQGDPLQQSPSWVIMQPLV